jgi:2-polyprenyl-3-methyl-5-hydroxy-6-metoxy-1,4-benzoquinol methylase
MSRYIEELQKEIDRLKRDGLTPDAGGRERFEKILPVGEGDGKLEEELLVEGLHFDVVLRRYPWAQSWDDIRYCLKRKVGQRYEDLQSIRSNWWHWDDAAEGVEKLKDKLKEETPNLFSSTVTVDTSMVVRLNELEHLKKEGHSSLSDDATIIELGFRTPTWMEYFRQKGVKFIGYDVVRFNILRAKALGYDARYYDFDNCDPDLDLSEGDLIMCYQMLEHLSDPYTTLLKIYSSMKSGAYLHAEIPIEPGFPRVKFGHMFPFGQNDLQNMVTHAGFRLIGWSPVAWPDAPEILRVFCVKP